MLDSDFRVATPEGVELHLRPAGPVPRALAWAIDFGWRLALMLALAMALLPFGGAGTGLLLLAWFALDWLLPAWLEARWGGATPGKRLLGMMVLRDDGAPCGLREALLRNLLRWADFLPLLYLGGLLAMLTSAQFKRLGDHVAGTVVVYAEKPVARRALPPATPRRPPRPLSVEEARAVLDFAERSRELGPARSAELAELARPWLGVPAGAAVPAMIEIANHLAGEPALAAAEPVHAPARV